jgi:hypothetical protein
VTVVSMFQLRCGQMVLAKGDWPLSYTNATQAERKAASMGPGWRVFKRARDRHWFVTREAVPSCKAN